MDENSYKATSRLSHRRRSSIKEGLHEDVRNLWSTATMSESTANVSLSKVCENFDDEGQDLGKSRRRYSQSISLKESLCLPPEEIQQHALLELELHRGRSVEQDIEEEREDSKTDIVKSASELSVSHSKQTPHPAYWAEQQNRLPLPLMELMENEALEILNKALTSEPPRP
ncbi:cation channel sperm-associated protein subunit zeta isoform X2 [Nannospalax galili]|uniref:cation channel sperm-associated protein subunit zeta isoform X2 n=1 Tax=Nannospalax galili TaxID=1026970 RepID=UPI00111C80BC|nr:cation channel sperm-associated protein subunit zeta isoform X2 [Nannospalax galili]